MKRVSHCPGLRCPGFQRLAQSCNLNRQQPLDCLVLVKPHLMSIEPLNPMLRRSLIANPGATLNMSFERVMLETVAKLPRIWGSRSNKTQHTRSVSQRCRDLYAKLGLSDFKIKGRRKLGSKAPTMQTQGATWQWAACNLTAHGVCPCLTVHQ